MEVVPVAAMTPDDVDEVAVERACQGDRTVRLNAAELAAAFRYLTARGCSASQIAGRLGVSDRTVKRWRNGTYMPQGRRAS